MPAGTITALQAQGNGKERVNIFIDGIFAVSVNLRVVQSAGLYKGQQLSAEEFVALQDLERADQAYEAALRFLETRPRSEREVRDRLRQRGFSDPQIEVTIERLRSLDLINDIAFARFWVENRQAHRPRGAYALRQELHQKGVAADVIAAVLDEYLTDEDQEMRALALGRAALRRYATTDYRSFTRRMGGYLQRRGFGYETITRVLAALWAERNSSAPPAEDVPFNDRCLDDEGL